MARRRKKPESVSSPHHLYMAALQDIADQTQRQLARLMPHHGERGRLTEDIVKNVLSRTLPKRFSIGTGVVISAHGDVSCQTDIVIYDNFFNAPLILESGICLFPAEIVFATIEVKSVLTPKELRSSMDAIMQMRRVGSQKKYVVPITVSEPQKPGGKTQGRMLNGRWRGCEPPRSWTTSQACLTIGYERLFPLLFHHTWQVPARERIQSR